MALRLAFRTLYLKPLLPLVAGGVVVALIPNRAIDPYEIFNPKKFGYIVLTLASLEYAGYVLTNFLGERTGALATGFLGGLVSSTAVLLTSSRRANTNPRAWRTLVCATLAAKLAAFIELLMIVGLISQKLLLKIAPPVFAAIAVGTAALYWLAREQEERTARIEVKSPLDWKGVMRLSLLLAGVLALISTAQLWLGDEATLGVSFLTGLFELHGVSLATATMLSQNQLSLQTASTSILVATGASLVAKIAICWTINQKKYARALTAVFLPLIAVIGLTSWLL